MLHVDSDETTDPIEDTPSVDTLEQLAEALETALNDVETAMALDQRLDGRSLCIASASLRALLPIVTDALAQEEHGFHTALAELGTSNAC